MRLIFIVLICLKINLPASAASGYQSRLVNGGKIRSRGFEAILKEEENEVKYFARIFLDLGWLTPIIAPLAKRMFQKKRNSLY